MQIAKPAGNPREPRSACDSREDCSFILFLSMSITRSPLKELERAAERTSPVIPCRRLSVTAQPFVLRKRYAYGVRQQWAG